MTTIEPRLIALLNNDALSESYPTSPSLELPPLQDPNILKASGRPLLLEPDASKRNGKPQHTNLISPVEEDEGTHKSGDTKKKATNAADRALGNSSPQSLRKILDDNTGDPSTLPSKKRHIVESSKDEFVQLPQPPKKHKAAKQVVPPIIIGLFEPPPQAALFPPIASSSFHDSHGRNSLNTVPPKVKVPKESSKPDDVSSPIEKKKPASKGRMKKDVKARKKWSEEETNNLLLGVHKHGVGKWTDILEDPDFTFNQRSGVDLKDRFRTCCPDELRGKNHKSTTSTIKSESCRKKPTSSLLTENILIREDDNVVKDNGSDNSSSNKSRKSRAHRKKLEDLAQLGIDGPFRKSQRRERRPFSEEDDREILSGYQVYGAAWTRIQRDPRFHLQSRQATDLRDRFRNKYPEKFRSEETTPKEASKVVIREKDDSTTTPPSSSLQSSSSREGLRIHQIISENENTASKSSQAQMSGFSFKDNFPSFSDQTAEPVDGLPTFDWNANAPFSSSLGDMEISRLLLDESWIDNPNGKEKQSFTDINSILSSSGDGLPQVSSYYGMLVNDEQINMSSSVAMDPDSSFG